MSERVQNSQAQCNLLAATCCGSMYADMLTPKREIAAENIMAEPVRCPQGHVVESDATVCPECGSRTEDGTSLSQSPLPSPTQPFLPKIEGYEIIAELGRGGMGRVYKARHLRLKRLVALKVILAGEFADAAVVERFRREAAALARLQSPAIVQIFDVGEYQGKPFLVLEFVDGM